MTVVLDVFRVIAATTSTLMLLSPVPTIYHVYKTKSTGVGSIVPLVSMLANSHANIVYGYMSEHYFPIFSTFVFGDLVCLAYIAIFYSYSPEKRKAHRVFLMFGIPIALLSLYAFLGGFGVTGQSREQVATIVGYAPVVSNLILYSSPFEKIALVLKHRSAVFLNIHMVTMGTINNLVWLTYTELAGIWIIFAPMVFCSAGGCIQLVLYVIFHPSTHPYTGPMPGEKEIDLLAIDIELAEEEMARTKSQTKRDMASPSFTCLASPLEPPAVQSHPV